MLKRSGGSLVAALLLLSVLTAVPIAAAQTASFTYSVSVTPSSLQVTQGQSGTVNISVSPGSGSQGTVHLSTPCFVPASCVFGEPSGTAPFTSNLTIATTAQTPQKSYSLTITASGGGFSANTTLDVTVGGGPAVYAVGVSPQHSSVVAGHSIQTTVMVTSPAGSSPQIGLGVNGCPTGAICTLSPKSGTSPFNSTMTIATNSTMMGYTYQLTIFGASGQANVTATYLLTVTQDGFTVSISPGSENVAQGATTSATVSVASYDPDGAGIPPVNLSISGCPSGVICGVSPTTGAPPFSSVLDVAATDGAQLGTYTIMVTGTGTGYTASSAFQLTIAVATSNGGLQVSVSPPLVGVSPGQNATAQITVQPSSSAKTQGVVINAQCKPPVSCFISTPSSGALNGTLHIFTTNQTLPGSYEVTVLASGGGINGSARLNGSAIFTLLVRQASQYTVTFNESGLPPGTQWTVTLGGVQHSEAGNITIAIGTGIYNYTVSAVPGYNTAPSSGTITVLNSLSVQIVFSMPGLGHPTSGTSPSSPPYLIGGVGVAVLVVIAIVVLKVVRKPKVTHTAKARGLALVLIRSAAFAS